MIKFAKAGCVVPIVGAVGLQDAAGETVSLRAASAAEQAWKSPSYNKDMAAIVLQSF